MIKRTNNADLFSQPYIFNKGANIIGRHCTYLCIFFKIVHNNVLLLQLNGCNLFFTMFHHFKTNGFVVLCIRIEEIIS